MASDYWVFSGSCFTQVFLILRGAAAGVDTPPCRALCSAGMVLTEDPTALFPPGQLLSAKA